MNRRNNILLAGIIAAFFCVSAVSAVSADDRKLLFDEDKIVMVPTRIGGDSASTVHIYNCYGDYLDTREEFIIGFPYLVEKNTVFYSREEGHYNVCQYSDGRKCIQIPGENLSFRELENYILCSWRDSGNTAVYDCDGNQVLFIPGIKREDSGIGIDVVVKKYPKGFMACIPVIDDEEVNRKIVLFDEAGTETGQIKDSELVNAFYEGHFFVADDLWVIEKEEQYIIYNQEAHIVDQLSKEEYKEQHPTDYELQTKEKMELAESLQIDVKDIEQMNEDMMILTEKEDNTVINRRIVRKTDGEELAVYDSRDFDSWNQVSLGDGFWILKEKTGEEVSQTGYKRSTYRYHVFNYDGEETFSVDEPATLQVVDRKHLFLTHGKFRGFIDISGNWLLRVIGAEE